MLSGTILKQKDSSCKKKEPCVGSTSNTFQKKNMKVLIKTLTRRNLPRITKNELNDLGISNDFHWTINIFDKLPAPPPLRTFFISTDL